MNWYGFFNSVQKVSAQIAALFGLLRIRDVPLLLPPIIYSIRRDYLFLPLPIVCVPEQEHFLLQKGELGSIRTINPKYFLLQKVNTVSFKGIEFKGIEDAIEQDIDFFIKERPVSGDLLSRMETAVHGISFVFALPEVADVLVLVIPLQDIDFFIEERPVSGDLLSRMETAVRGISFDFPAAEILDVTAQLSEIPIPPIHGFALIRRGVIDGKAYNIHLPKKDRPKKSEGESGVAAPKPAGIRQRPPKRFDLWELIHPILLPPLGEALNHTFEFPEDKFLYGFQKDGVQFLTENSAALLGDEMGLGKSIQTITALRVLIRKGKITSCCVLCPKAVLSDWDTKFYEWSPELLVIKVSGDRRNRESQWQMSAHVHIATYESLRNDKDAVHKKRQHQKTKTHFDLLVMDEIQKTKNPASKLTKTVRELEANYRWGLSGTPLENGTEDLLTICRTLDGAFLARRTDVVSPLELKTAFQPMFLRRRIRDVLAELPQKITDVVWLDLLPNQRRAYDEEEKSGRKWLCDLGEKATFREALAVATQLKLICNYYDGESPKQDFLIDKLEDLTEQGSKALVFSQYPNETLKKIEPKLKPFHPLFYDGSLSDTQRTQRVEKFQKEEGNKIMLLSLKAGNAGITLTRANWVFHFDMWWNPAVAQQAAGRALRIGQEKTVFERFLLTRGTIEERIYHKVKEKEKLFNVVVDDLSEEQVTGKIFTSDDIFDLFGLEDPKKRRGRGSLPEKTDTATDKKDIC